MKLSKKIISALCCSLILLTPINSASAYIRGDIDGNNRVDTTDSSLLMMYLNGYQTTNCRYQQQRLDVNRDGVIGNSDRVYLRKILANQKPSSNEKYSYYFGITKSENTSYYKYDCKTGKKLETYAITPAISMKNYQVSAAPSQYDREVISNCSNRTTGSATELNPQLVCIGGVGTGFIVDAHTILTAGHCVADGSLKEDSSEYDVFINPPIVLSDGRTATPLTYHIPEKWLKHRTDPAKGDDSTYYGYDYAVITVKEDLTSYIKKSSRKFDLGVISNDNKQSSYIVSEGYVGSINNKYRGRTKITGMKDRFFKMNIEHRSGMSGGISYVEDDDSITVVGIIAKTQTSTRITPDILKFVYNNPKLS